MHSSLDKMSHEDILEYAKTKHGVFFDVNDNTEILRHWLKQYEGENGMRRNDEGQEEERNGETQTQEVKKRGRPKKV